MKKSISFAQKGIILDRSRSKILVIKYSSSKYMSEKVANHSGLPGGKIDFGEDLDRSFIREVKEETNTTIIPGPPIYAWTWVYKKEAEEKQIVALARVGYFKSGEPLPSLNEKETTIESVFWLPIKEIILNDFIWDERPALEKFIQFKKINPFIK